MFPTKHDLDEAPLLTCLDNKYVKSRTKKYFYGTGSLRNRCSGTFKLSCLATIVWVLLLWLETNNLFSQDNINLYENFKYTENTGRERFNKISSLLVKDCRRKSAVQAWICFLGKIRKWYNSWDHNGIGRYITWTGTKRIEYFQ